MLKVFENVSEVGLEAAKILTTEIVKNPSCVVALPTGTTPLKMYERFVHIAESGLLDFDNVKFFNLDEYVGLTPDNPLSYAKYMEENLFSKISAPYHKIPKSDTLEPEKEAKKYEQMIEEAGWFDVCFLGIGTDGHIGFNEPGSSFSSLTRVVELHPSTVERNSKQSGKQVPSKAITVGIKTIMKSRRIVLMATGKEKAKIVTQAFTQEITTQVPASILQLHPNFTLLLDKEAALYIQRQ